MLHDLPGGGAPDTGMREQIYARGGIQRADPMRLAGVERVDGNGHDIVVAGLINWTKVVRVTLQDAGRPRRRIGCQDQRASAGRLDALGTGLASTTMSRLPSIITASRTR